MIWNDIGAKSCEVGNAKIDDFPMWYAYFKF